MQRHLNDEFVKRSKREGYRSRAVYKLDEIQQKDHILRPGSVVVDLGAAPGGWSQYAAQFLKGKGRIVALDILPMDPLPGVEFLQGDFREDDVLDALNELLGGATVNLVMSDMAPNMSGMGAVDQPRAMYLAELALDFATNWLEPGGSFVVKVFHGEGFDDFVKQSRSLFEKVQVRKPKASRPRSREVYILGHRRKLQ